MNETGAVMFGLIIGVVLVLTICAALYGYQKIKDKISYGFESERKIYRKFRDKAEYKYNELDKRITAIENLMESDNEDNKP